MNKGTLALLSSISLLSISVYSSQTEAKKQQVTVTATVIETTRAFRGDDVDIGFNLDDRFGGISAYANNPTSSKLVVKEIAAQSKSCKYTATIDTSVEPGEQVFFKIASASDFESCVHPDKVKGGHSMRGMSADEELAELMQLKAAEFMMSTTHVIDKTIHKSKKPYYTFYTD